MDILYMDAHIIVCIKPARVLSTDEPGGLPELLRQHLEDENADIRTVHRLDRVVSGVMVLVRNTKAASDLSRQIREDQFTKEYLAVIHGIPEEKEGTWTDLLYRDKARKMTIVAAGPGKGVQEAILDYQILNRTLDASLVKIQLRTGRTHQIRVQFSCRGMPLFGERKYSTREDPCEIALWSHKIGFFHPHTGQWLEFQKSAPEVFPWTQF